MEVFQAKAQSNPIPFVRHDSIVRKIWGTSDVVLLIFGGAAAEFALNKAVDWLYFTGRLPTDPIGRLFSTVTYAKKIIFSSNYVANKTIDAIHDIHKVVEKNRHSRIPDWAYLDVLYMLIHYSIASFELLERKLSLEEKYEVYDVFYRFGARMKLNDLPTTYDEWLTDRSQKLNNDLINSDFTIDLFKQYKKNLGGVRYKILIEAQKMVIPGSVRQMLGYSKFSFFILLIPLYKISRFLKADALVKKILFPAKYYEQIIQLDTKNNR
ncbi:MAG: oxygenase MpaB family protein [Ginsengibacter sp.]